MGAMELVRLAYFDAHNNKQVEHVFRCSETGEPLSVSNAGVLEEHIRNHCATNISTIMLDNDILPVFDHTGESGYTELCEELVTKAIFYYLGTGMNVSGGPLTDKEKNVISSVFTLAVKNHPLKFSDVVDAIDF